VGLTSLRDDWRLRLFVMHTRECCGIKALIAAFSTSLIAAIIPAFIAE
jgi:hypothetical protein